MAESAHGEEKSRTARRAEKRAKSKTKLGLSLLDKGGPLEGASEQIRSLTEQLTNDLGQFRQARENLQSHDSVMRLCGKLGLNTSEVKMATDLKECETRLTDIKDKIVHTMTKASDEETLNKMRTTKSSCTMTENQKAVLITVLRDDLSEAGRESWESEATSSEGNRKSDAEV